MSEQPLLLLLVSLSPCAPQPGAWGCLEETERNEGSPAVPVDCIQTAGAADYRLTAEGNSVTLEKAEGNTPMTAAV